MIETLGQSVHALGVTIGLNTKRAALRQHHIA